MCLSGVCSSMFTPSYHVEDNGAKCEEFDYRFAVLPIQGKGSAACIGGSDPDTKDFRTPLDRCKLYRLRASW